MNHTSALGLINNVALLLVLCLLSEMLGFRLQERKTIIRQILTGIVLGAIGLAIMSSPWTFGQGVVFDTRSVLLVISGFFFGSIPVIIAVLMTGIFRFITGGAGVWTGLAVIVTSGVIGLCWRRCRPHKNQKPSITELYLLGIVVHVVMLGCFFILPWQFALDVLSKISLPVMILYPIATAILGNLMVMSEKRRQYDKNLRESEERYRELVENANSIILRMDSKGQVRFFNEFAQKFFGYAPHEIIGRNVVGTIVPETNSAGRDLLSMITNIGLQPQLYMTNENENVRKDGSRIWIAWTNKPFYDATGRVSEILCVGHDITERRRIEKELQKSESQHRSILQTAMDGFWLVDLQGRLLNVNAAYCQMSGYTSQELLGIWISELVAEGTQADIDADIQKVISQGRNRFLSRHRHKTGKILDMEISVQYKSPNEYITVFLRDITEQRRAEAELIESSQRLKLAVASGKLGIWDWNVKDNIMVWDDRMFELYGITPDIFPSNIEAWTSGIHPDDKQRALDECDAAIEGLKKFNTTFRVLHPDGTVKFLKANAMVIRDDAGKAVRMIGINRDITDRRRADEENKKLQNQLQQAQKMEAVGHLAGGVAHDYNNMLGVILGHAEMALEGLDNDHPLSNDLKIIQDAAQRSADITRQLLAFARKQTIAPRMTDINPSVEGMLRMLQRLIGENIALVLKPGYGLWKVKIDASQLDQIIANLCVNARDAISDVGTITIETSNCVFDEEYCKKNVFFTAGDYVLLTVSDTGCGMDNATLEHIFEPFFTTKNIGKGSGLGLATVYGIVKQNNGFINAYSELGQGTTFKVYLPRYISNTDQDEIKEVAKPVKGGTETILLVEDEPTILDMTTKMLQRLGYSVIAMGSPGKAIQAVEDSGVKIHLLITDLVMPEMNGKELSEKLLLRQPELQILFMSGYTANVIAHSGVLDDGVYFLQKPFSKKDLAAKIRMTLD